VSRNATTEITSAAWRDDLRYLASELASHHINAFHTTGRETFAGEVARLNAAIPSMNGDEVLVGLMRIWNFAGVPDRHIEPTWAEFRAGRDPVMEWILRKQTE
jgi:hypothetical protein